MPYEASHILPMLSSCAETTSTISISSTVTSLAHWASNCFFARTRKRCHEDWQFVQNPDSVAAPPAAQPVAFALGRFPISSAHLAKNSFNVSRIVVIHDHTQDLRRSRAHGLVSFLCCKKRETQTKTKQTDPPTNESLDASTRRDVPQLNGSGPTAGQLSEQANKAFDSQIWISDASPSRLAHNTIITDNSCLKAVPCLRPNSR